jgi:hypothetical protein
MARKEKMNFGALFHSSMLLAIFVDVGIRSTTL